jgi:trimeric autotransporter adhesin
MTPLIFKFKKVTPLCLIVFAVGCFALSPQTRAINPPNTPDPPPLSVSNTADGDSALLGATGFYNSAFGFLSLLSNGAANFNTGVGAGTLLSNTGDNNTAVGAGALFSNTIGISNTANGVFALFSNTTGGSNTAIGASALQSNTIGIFNTANGATALFSNATGNNNTGVGVGALLNNTTNSFNTALGTTALAGNSADGNTGVGAAALFTPNTGPGNTAVGAQALFSNTGDTSDPPNGRLNTAVGIAALFSNTIGNGNTAVGGGLSEPIGGANGLAPLASNTTGDGNTAVGGTVGVNPAALGSNTTGRGNTAVGASASLGDNAALSFNTMGNNNTAIGRNALGLNTTGSTNIAVGRDAGSNLTTGDNNIDIGNPGVADEANTIRIGESGTQTATFIAGISGTAVVGDAVVVGANGQLGTATSSARFKKDIKPMDKTSEAILSFKPVSFHYKSDNKGTAQFGLIAEEVAKVNPDLVVRDRNGEIYSVRYEAVNAMLLNEFLKEHRTVQEQQKEIDALNAELKEQRALIQKVNDKVEFDKPAAQTVLSNR